MKKNINLLLALTLLLGLVGFALYQRQGKQQSDFFKDVHTLFTIEDIETVHRIFIADKKGNQALLEKKEDYWSYTNKKSQTTFAAHPTVIKELLSTLKRIRVRNPIPSAAMDNVIKSLAANAKKVEIYDQHKNKLLTYYIGAMAQGGTGNYAILEDSDQPYVVYIPNFVGTLDTRFVLEEEYLRDLALWRLAPLHIEWIELLYQHPQQQQLSFRLEQKANQVQILPKAKEIEPIDQTLLNKDNVETFLEEFSTVYSERLEYNTAIRDSVIQTNPFLIIRYKTSKKEKIQQYTIYSRLNPNNDRGDNNPGLRSAMQRYFIDAGPEFFYTAQHNVIKTILLPYSSFFKEEKAPLIEENVPAYKTEETTTK